MGCMGDHAVCLAGHVGHALPQLTCELCDTVMAAPAHLASPERVRGGRFTWVVTCERR